jgi:methanethiol S-methyltransferase
LPVDPFTIAFYCFFFLLLFLIGVRGKGKWRQRGMATGFVVALFTEMWGLPLSLLVITSIAGGSGLPYQFDNLMYYFVQHRNPTDVAFYNVPLSFLMEYTIARAVTLLSIFPIIYGWFTLKNNLSLGLVTTGPYAYSRNPQYIGFILFTIGMVLYWPSLLTIPMGCILIFAYWRLALTEEKTLKEFFKDKYNSYAQKVPRFLSKMLYKIFRLPKGMNITEKIVVTALGLPFVLWFGEALFGLLAGESFIRAYWLPIAYIFPVHIGVIISVLLLLPIGLFTLGKWLIKKRKKMRKGAICVLGRLQSLKQRLPVGLLQASRSS